MRYNNHHKHTHETNVKYLDCIVKPIDYINRAIELNHTTYFTTEHGWAGNFLLSYDLCKNNNLKMIFATEAYIVKDRFEKDKTNAHIVIIAKNINGFKQINKILSESNISGFYYRNRIDIELIKQLNPNDVFITTACVAGIASSSLDLNDFIISLKNHFKQNFFLEVQSHNHKIQIEHNKHILSLSENLNIPIIHANDSHYIYPEQSKDRDLFLKGKGLNYEEENGFILDYPDYNTIIERYKIQSVLNEKQINEAINNTLIFDSCEDLNFTKEVKMPSYKSEIDKNTLIKQILNEKFKKEMNKIDKNKHKEYINAIRFEADIIEKTNMADYFLWNEKITDRAINKYNGVLTRSGRGCFTKDALVHTKNTFKSIKDIDIGDEVITKDGNFNKVINKFVYYIDEHLIQIKHLYGTDKYYPTICTLDHQILINRNDNIQWIKAKDITKGDFVCVPKINNSELLPDYIDLNDYNKFGFKYDNNYIYEYSPYINNEYNYSPTEVSKAIGVGKSIFEKFANGNKKAFSRKQWALDKFFELFPFKTQEEYVSYIRQKRTRIIPRFIKLNKKFNRFIGLMYGDGFTCKKGYSIGLAINSINQKDIKNKAYFYEIANRLNLQVYENNSSDKNLTQLYINSKIFSTFIEKELFISKIGKEKQFNSNWFNQNKDNLLGLIEGLMLSDGSFSETRISFDNTSKSLINAYKLLCLMTNKGVNSLSVRPSWINKQNYTCKESYKLRINPNAKNTCKITEKIKEDKKYWYLPIKETIMLPKTKTKVYDITVENESNYLINNMIVHNSAVSFYVNKLFGFTEIDRIDSDITLYPTRFMSISRILETGSLPDIDFNWADIEAPIKASKDLLGDDGVYYMYALGTMQKSEAFRNLCRAYGLNMEDYNEVGKNIDDYVEHEYWGKLIKESEKFIGVIDSVSPSPCSFVLLDKPISEELGLIRVGKPDNYKICACIDGLTADIWKYLKNDYLVVRVWHIISETFKLLNIPIPNIKELKSNLDNKVWDLYSKGLTATLNQVDTDSSTKLVMQYKPKNIAELSAFVAAIRPGFSSLLNKFINREKHSTGISELDEILKDSYNYLLYQESIMKFLIWCGIPEDGTYDIIKKIAKKKFKTKELNSLKKILIKGFVKNTGSEDKFDEVWQVVEDAANYSFNASHSLSVAWDSVYGAYLKANYPLEYYTVVLNEYIDDANKTGKIISELPYFNIKINPVKFRYSHNKYMFDKETNTIFKGITSIKGIGEKANIANQLLQFKDKKYCSFVDLLFDIKEQTNIGIANIKILTELDFFSEFGDANLLIQIIDIFELLHDRKQLSKDKLHEVELTQELVEKHAGKVTEKLYKELNMKNIINEKISTLKYEKRTPIDILLCEHKYYTYMQSTFNVPKEFVIVIDIDLKYAPKLKTYTLATGEEKTYKIYKSKLYSQQSYDNPNIEQLINIYDVIRVDKFYEKPRQKKVGNDWVDVEGETELLLDRFKVAYQYNDKNIN